MSKRLAPILVIAAILLAGCEETDSGDTMREFGKPSGVERVPVPSNAKRIDGLNPNDATFEVPGWSYSRLRAWYGKEMPDGIGWYQWDWCDIGGGATVGESLIYSKPGRRILTVALVNDTTPGIIVGTDESGPC